MGGTRCEQDVTQVKRKLSCSSPLLQMEIRRAYLLQSGVPRLTTDARKRYRRVEKSGGEERTVLSAEARSGGIVDREPADFDGCDNATIASRKGDER
jgi:hypothetical protein